MTLLVGQNGGSFGTPIGANPWGTGGNAIYYKNGYTAVAGAMTNLHFTVQATASATLATGYVYSGTGPGASFVAMSAEVSVTTTGDKAPAISGSLVVGPYILIVQTSAGSFQVTVNSGSNSFQDNQNVVANFPYRGPPSTLPALDNNSGQEFVIWIDGMLAGGVPLAWTI
jgi:hypothetical protein